MITAVVRVMMELQAAKYEWDKLRGVMFIMGIPLAQSLPEFLEILVPLRHPKQEISQKWKTTCYSFQM